MHTKKVPKCGPGKIWANICQNHSNPSKLGQICSVSTMTESLDENYDHNASNSDAYTLWV